MLLNEGQTPQPNQKISSVEAASLLISDGATKDPVLASHIQAGGKAFDMDELQRSHLRRMMGFDFDVSINEMESTIHVWSKEGPRIELAAKYYDSNIDEKAIDILVETCLMVKQLWERQNEVVS